MQHGPAVRSLPRLERDPGQVGGVIELVAIEGIPRGEARLEAGELVGAGTYDVDIGIERRVQAGFQMNVAQAQRQRGAWKQQGE
jgi:hypothetical protein